MSANPLLRSIATASMDGWARETESGRCERAAAICSREPPTMARRLPRPLPSLEPSPFAVIPPGLCTMRDAFPLQAREKSQVLLIFPSSQFKGSLSDSDPTGSLSDIGKELSVAMAAQSVPYPALPSPANPQGSVVLVRGLLLRFSLQILTCRMCNAWALRG